MRWFILFPVAAVALTLPVIVCAPTSQITARPKLVDPVEAQLANPAMTNWNASATNNRIVDPRLNTSETAQSCDYRAGRVKVTVNLNTQSASAMVFPDAYYPINNTTEWLTACKFVVAKVPERTVIVRSLSPAETEQRRAESELEQARMLETVNREYLKSKAKRALANGFNS